MQSCEPTKRARLDGGAGVSRPNENDAAACLPGLRLVHIQKKTGSWNTCQTVPKLLIVNPDRREWTWSVPGSEPGTAYRVKVKALTLTRVEDPAHVTGSCTCPDADRQSRRGLWCKHVVRAATTLVDREAERVAEERAQAEAERAAQKERARTEKINQAKAVFPGEYERITYGLRSWGAKKAFEVLFTKAETVEGLGKLAALFPLVDLPRAGECRKCKRCGETVDSNYPWDKPCRVPHPPDQIEQMQWSPYDELYRCAICGTTRKTLGEFEDDDMSGCGASGSEHTFDEESEEEEEEEEEIPQVTAGLWT